MSEDLEKLIELARTIEMTASEEREQRISFVYGNTHFENERITRETVERAVRELEAKDQRGSTD